MKTENKSAVNFLKLAKLAAEIAADKKCENICLLNVGKLTSVAEYFLIASVESQPQMNAVTETIFKAFKEKGISPVHGEWKNIASWAIIDYGGLVVHIMLPKTREFYSLEKIWVGARRINTNG